MLRCPCMHAHRASLRRLQLSWSCTGSGHSTSDAHQTSFQRTRWCILRKQHNAANRVNRKVTAENLTTTDQVSFTKYRKDATPRKGNDVKSSKENTVAELPSTVTGLEQFLKLDRVTVVKCIKDFTGEETIPKDFVIDKELVKRIIKHFGRETELPSDPKPPPRSDILSKKKVEPIETPVETSVTTSPEMTDYLTRLKNIGKEVTVLRFPIANMLTVTKQSTESIRNTESLNKNIDDRMAKERTLSMKQNFIARQNMKEDLIARQNMKEDLIARQDMKEDLLARQTTKEDLISRQNMKEDLIAKQTMKEDLIARQNMKDDLISRQNMKGDLIARQTMKEDLIAMQTRKEDMVARLAKFRQGTSSVYGSQALVTMPQSTAELCARLGVGKDEVLRQVQEITGQTFKEDEIMADKVLLTRLLSRTANHTGVNWKPRVKAYTPETMGKVEVETISSNKIESHQTFMHKEQLIFENKTKTASEVASKTVNRSEQHAGHEKSELKKKSIKTELPIAGKMMADISSEKS